MPPYLRVVEHVRLAERLEQRARCAPAAMPMPVSRTANAEPDGLAPAGVDVTGHDDFARAR